MLKDDFGVAGEAGFSFLELVVCLVLLSLVSLTLTWSLHLGIETWNRVSIDSDSQADVYAAQNALRLFIEQAVSNRSKGELSFAGNRQHLTFVANAPPELGFGGEYEITIQTQKRDDGQVDLVLLPTVHNPHAQPTSGTRPTTTVLIENVEDISLRYYGSDNGKPVSDWSTEWGSRTQLPEFISVDVSFTGNSKKFWPTLLVSPRLSEEITR